MTTKIWLLTTLILVIAAIVAATGYLVSRAGDKKEAVYSEMHRMINTKIISEDGQVWGKEEITPVKCDELIDEVSKGNFKDKEKLLGFLARWKVRDFSEAVTEHNYIWSVLGGTTGKATSNATAKVNTPVVPEYQLTEADLPQNTVGNSNNNVSNGGMVSFQGSSIYLVNRKIDTLTGVDKRFFFNGEEDVFTLGNVNVVGEWICFTNTSRKALEKGILKMRIDGKSRSILTNDLTNCMIVEGEWIYYTNSNDESKLYKMKTDGSLKTKISDDTKVENFNYYNGSLYYSKYDSDYIYKVTTDGTLPQMVNNKEKIMKFCVNNNLIYYTSFVNQDLYKMNLDGSNKILLSKKIQSFNVTQEYIYYTKNTSIRRLTVDGNNDTEIYNGISPKASVGNEIYVVGDYIVFNGFHDDNNIYKIKNDGTGLMVYKQGWVKSSE